MNYQVGDQFQNPEKTYTYTITQINEISVGMKMEGARKSSGMEPVGDLYWKVQNNFLIPINKNITNKLETDCSHIWKEEQYFSARIFTNCTLCGIAKD